MQSHIFNLCCITKPVNLNLLLTLFQKPTGLWKAKGQTLVNIGKGADFG